MRELCQSDLARMPSDLQRAARGLVDCLDQIPRMVSYLQRLAIDCRQNAALVADVSSGNPTARQAAMQLDAAARACEEAAHFASIAPVKARDWAVAMVGGVETAPKSTTPPVRAVSGGRRAWNRDLDRPGANTSYLVDDRYTFSTDGKGRVVLVEGKLTVGKKDRSAYRQRVAGGIDRRPGDDDGGHLIANRFMGPSEAINLVAQLRAQNRPSALDGANW
jgi:hypothetical protein